MTKDEAIEALTQIQYDEKDRVHKGWELWSAKSPRIEALDMAIEALKQPQIIRCKDCKWFNELGCAIRIVDDTDRPNEDDFCSFAERRTE